MEIQDPQRKCSPGPIDKYFRPIPNHMAAATAGPRGGTLSDNLISELNELWAVGRRLLRVFQTFCGLGRELDIECHNNTSVLVQ